MRSETRKNQTTHELVTKVRVAFWFEQEVYEKLRAIAASNGRSINAEVKQILKEIVK
jgi:hypothetical protein